MATISSTTVTVNAAFLREIKEVNEELWQLVRLLRDVSGHPYELASRRDWFSEALEQLRDQLALHFALEEAYGYFEDPVFVAPRLCRTAERLRSEHRELYEHVCCLAEFACCTVSGPDVSVFAQQLGARFSSFYCQLMAHESQEEELILQAYEDDLGVGD